MTPTTQQSALAVFNRAWAQITMKIEYRREWSDGQGYHGPIIHHRDFQTLPVGAVLRSCSPGDRRLIIIKTQHGPMVVFERYMPDDKRGQHFAANAPEAIHALFNENFEEGGLIEPISAANLTAILGQSDVHTENLGVIFSDDHSARELY